MRLWLQRERDAVSLRLIFTFVEIVDAPLVLVPCVGLFLHGGGGGGAGGAGGGGNGAVVDMIGGCS